MASKIQVINLSLRHLAEQPIGAIDEGSEAANVMGDLYDYALEDEIRRFPYTWATRTATLAQVEDETPPDYAYVYQLPADYLMMDRIIDNRTSTTYSTDNRDYNNINMRYREWAIREDKLYINSSSICLEYRVLEVDTTKWDSSFVMAFSYKLAELAGPSITESERLIARAERNYIRHINEARASNGNERNRDTRLSEDYLNARNA